MSINTPFRVSLKIFSCHTLQNAFLKPGGISYKVVDLALMKLEHAGTPSKGGLWRDISPCNLRPYHTQYRLQTGSLFSFFIFDPNNLWRLQI